MICLFKLRPASFFCGILLGFLLAACSATPPGITQGAESGAAGAAQTAGAGGSANAASASNASAGATAGEASQAAAGAPDVESAGSAGSPITAGGGSGGRAGGAEAGGSGAEESAGKAGESSAGSGGTGEDLMVPCDVYAAYGVCHNCHVDPPLNGAPMPLLTLLDLQTYAAAEFQAISTGVMPKVGTLSAEEAALILGWLSTGAQGVPHTDCP